MGFFFQFTDVPDIGQIWETELDIDVTIHTRPALVAERDRFARAYGTNYAREELRGAVIRGLKNFGYEVVPRIDHRLQDELYDLRHQACDDAIIANGALDECWVEGDDYRAHERELLEMTLDTPKITARFVREVAVKLDELDPIERMRHIYALRGRSIGERIPYARHAAGLLAEAFGSASALPRLDAPRDVLDPRRSSDFEMILEAGGNTVDALFVASTAKGRAFDNDQLDVETLRHRVIADAMEGLSARLVDDTDFLDELIAEWVVPRLAESFEEMDERIDDLLNHFAPDAHITREQLLANDRHPEWIELAAELGSPLPENAPGHPSNAE